MAALKAIDQVRTLRGASLEIFLVAAGGRRESGRGVLPAPAVACLIGCGPSGNPGAEQSGRRVAAENHEAPEAIGSSWLLAANGLGAPMQSAGAGFVGPWDGMLELSVEHADAREHAGGGLVILTLRNASQAKMCLAESLSAYEFTAADYFDKRVHTPVYCGPATVFELDPGQTRITEQFLWRGSQSQPQDYAMRVWRLSYRLRAA